MAALRARAFAMDSLVPVSAMRCSPAWTRSYLRRGQSGSVWGGTRQHEGSEGQRTAARGGARQHEGIARQHEAV
eukprot:6307803-Prymnesium_polylepis.1